MSATTGGRNEKASETGFVRDTATIFKRWSLKTIRDPLALAVSLLQPIVFLLLFSSVFASLVEHPDFPTDNYTQFIVPAIVLQAALVTAANSGFGLIDDIESGMFDRILATPIRRTSLFFGKALSEISRVVAQVLVILAIGYLLGGRIESGLVGVVAIVAIAALFSIWFAALSNVVAVVTESVEATNIIPNLLQLVLLFLSPAFVPYDLLPGWLQVFSLVNPVTYGIRPIRTLMIDGFVLEPILRSVAVIVLLDVLFASVCVVYLLRVTSTNR